MRNGIHGIYKNHFRFCAKSLIFVYVPFVVISLITIFVMNGLIAPNYEKVVAAVGKIGYAGVVETSDKDDGVAPLFKLDNLVTVKSENDKRINVNLYSVVSGADSQAKKGYQFFEIKANEIVISKKIAQKINASVGSVIYLDYSFREEQTAYTISEITEYLTDYYDFEKNNDFSVAIVGSDNGLEEKAAGQYVSLVSNSDLDLFINGEYSYSSVFKTQDEIDLLTQKCIIKYIVIGLVYLVLALILALLTSKQIGKEVKKYYQVGYPINAVLKIRNADYLLFIGIPQAIVLVTLLTETIAGNFNPILFAGMFLTSIIVLGVLLLGKGNYATAYKL